MQIPIFATVREGFALALSQLAFLLRIGWFWIPLAVLATVGFTYGMWSVFEGLVPLWAIQLPGRLVHAICLAAIAVPWHRRILGDDERFASSRLRLTVMYALVAMGFELIGSAVLLPFIDVLSLDRGAAFAIVIVISIAIVLAFVRLSLLLPAIALEHGYSVREIWSRTRGNGWRLAVINIIVFWPFTLLAELLPDAPVRRREWSEWNDVYRNVASETIQFVGILFCLALLTVCYRRLILESDAGSVAAREQKIP